MNHTLTDPQVKLLLRLRDRPRPIVPYFRPLAPLISLELVRPRSDSFVGSNPSYELTTKGRALAQEILEEIAAKEELAARSSVID